MSDEGGRRHRSRFRSSFRDWAGNVSNFPREVTETALAHVIGDKAEQAYRRSDALEKRRKLMEAWASYCEPKFSTIMCRWVSESPPEPQRASKFQRRHVRFVPNH
jgi:hypothetical protein